MDAEAHAESREFLSKGPRITTLREAFDGIAEGRNQRPMSTVVADPAWLRSDVRLETYHELHQSYQGFFARHYYASIPFLLEETCRVGVAAWALALKHHSSDNPFCYYAPSGGDSPNGKTLATLSDGAARTLGDSPNAGNASEFFRTLKNNWSKFHLGPFFDVTPELLQKSPELAAFRGGFDFIRATTVFQFYGPERDRQIGYVARLLKPGGIMLHMEKLRQSSDAEYSRREQIKDRLFKSKYFTAEEMAWKATEMLEILKGGQVTLDVLAHALHKHFDHVVMIWNSTNFYELAASNNHDSLQEFLSELPPAHVPDDFLFERPVIRPL